MTARQLYEALLIEMNKVEAPSMLLEDFNYMTNKAVYQFLNKTYNMYDANQQMSDNIRVLKATAILTPSKDTEGKLTNSYNESGFDSLYGNIKEFTLPNDYLHMLNCICNYKVIKPFKCYKENSNVQFAARRLTSDMWSQVINNFYMRPTYRMPYYFIHNVNNINNGQLPTDNFQSPAYTITGDNEGNYQVNGENLNRTLTLKTKLGGDKVISTVDRASTIRYGNSEPVRLEIRYGKDSSVFELDKIYVDYIKTPQHILLTQEQLDLTEDYSQVLEFPDYVCQEIINELVKLMMENASDPRLQTNLPINQSIASPVPQGTQRK